MPTDLQRPSNKYSAKTGALFVLGAGAVWSTIGIGVRLIEEASVWQILFYRSISMALFLYVIIRLRTGEGPFGPIRRNNLAMGVAGVSLFAAYSSGIYALQNTSVANAMLLFAAAPFMAAILGWIIMRERIRATTWITMAIAVGGIAIMVGDKSGGVALKGSLSALLSAIGFAAFTVALRRGRTGEMLPAVFLSAIIAILITAFVCASQGLTFVLTPRDGSIALGMGVFQAGAGLVLYTLGSRSLPAAELTLLSMTEVLLGPVWVWLFLGETAGIYTLIGGFVLLAAIAGNALSGKSQT